MQLEVSELRRYFGNVKAVDNVSFAFGTHQIIGLVGPNGAGKTTMMRIMATLDEPTAGDVRIDGVSVVQYPERGRRLLGFVPDSLPSHRDITVHEYLDFFARACGLRGSLRRRVLESIEEFTNLTNLREKSIHALSKGMKQRVSVARALLHDPPVLVLDEPAAGLDPRARIELRELLRTLCDRGKAILVSSHILSELEQMITGVVILERGKLVHAGSLQEVLRQVTAQRIVRVRLLDGADSAVEKTLCLPHVESVTRADQTLRVAVQGGDAECAALLAEMVRQGISVVEFQMESVALEQVFLAVTKGEVA
ncbi:MAG: ABC transporter ATP-binding protein [Gemmatales bacterium]|nr:ABC transporter ATP-binding protein [Gemmatales bacterium]MCS7161215.1 ABC transporter ATP-binding protein [Gemmatales bacterium]MDW8176418.1 ABC transporter ATP-binding protein [Gemmatales bacterium]MDW8222777.1 ABC transporter ATP-binding protein [Gemmatales bacterium]